MEKLTVIKIGGNVIDNAEALDKFLGDLSGISSHKVLVHGGGKLATELSARLGIETKMVDGRRITDEETIKVVTMTYAGFINKTIVARLQAKGCDTMGLCGADARLVPAVRRPVGDIDYGWVGDIQTNKINDTLLHMLLQSGVTTVIAPISCTSDGHLLNINADTVAQSIAVAMSKNYDTTLLYCFEKKGVLRDVANENSAIPYIKLCETEALKSDGTISSGMIPKIDNACKAISDGVAQVVIGHAGDLTALINEQPGYGTRICR